MGRTLLGLVLLAGCAAQRPVTVAIPPLDRGVLVTAARSVDPVGDVQPIAVAMTNGQDGTLRFDATQAYAHDAGGGRVAPLPPGEAARRAGGRSLPGSVEGAAAGAARGGVMGGLGSAINGLVMGAVAGGVGVASAAGAAVGAVMGAVTGASSAGAADVAGFEDRALKSTPLAPTFSATGYLYYPRAPYGSLEILLTHEDGQVEAVTVPLTPEPD